MAAVWSAIASVTARMGVGDWLLVALGAVLAGLGLWALRSARRRVDVLVGLAPEDRPGGGGDATGGAGRTEGDEVVSASPATRYTLGLGLLILGYHAVAWGLPAGVVTMAWPAGWWWALVGLLGGLVGLARWMDRWEGLAG